MNFFERIITGMNDALRNAHKIGVTQPSKIGYNNVMVQRPVIGVGNAPQYWSDAFFVGYNSIVGGGTIAGNPPAAARTVLDFQQHTIGGPTQSGTLTASRELVPLFAQPNFQLEGRR